MIVASAVIIPSRAILIAEFMPEGRKYSISIVITRVWSTIDRIYNFEPIYRHEFQCLLYQRLGAQIVEPCFKMIFVKEFVQSVEATLR